jgi:serine/threonine-protein kinase
MSARRAAFEQEAQVVNEIKHPNIVDVFQFGELPDGRSYFVMEWLDWRAVQRADRARCDSGTRSDDATTR